MDLTDEQWALIQPLIPPPSPFSRGRPPADPRATLNGILYKLRLGAPWYNLPPYGGDRYPSWQTCYRAYRRWGQSGLIDQIFKLLYQDLRDRAGLDLFQSLRIGGAIGPMGHDGDIDPGGIDDIDSSTNLLEEEFKQVFGHGAITLGQLDSHGRLHLSPELENTWQGSTAQLLTQVLLTKVRSRLRQGSTRTLTFKTPEDR